MFRKASVNVKYYSFKTFCMNLYGNLFWDLNSEKVTSFYTLWRKCLRKLLDLPYTTHSRYIPLIVNDVPVEAQLFRRVNNFMCNMSASTNLSVKLCTKLVINGIVVLIYLKL